MRDMYSIVAKYIIKSPAAMTEASRPITKSLGKGFFDASMVATTSTALVPFRPAVPSWSATKFGVLGWRKHPLRLFLPSTSNLVEPGRSFGHRSQRFHTSHIMCANLAYDLHGLIVKDIVPATYYERPILPKDPPETFALALDWLYTRMFTAPRNGEHPTEWVCDPVEIFATAQMLGNKILMGAVMTAWIQSDASHSCLPSADFIDEVYNKFPTGSPSRRYMSWVMCWGTRDNPKYDRFVDGSMKSMVKEHAEVKEDFDL